VFKLLPRLEVLDGKNSNNESIYTEEDYGDEDGGEEGENEIDDELFEKLDPETKARILKGEISA
jgi:hypothetical protein